MSRTKAELALDVLAYERDWVLVRWPMLGLACAALLPVPGCGSDPGTDGARLFYDEDRLLSLFSEGRLHAVTLHLILHCLYLHIFPPKDAVPKDWNLACDVFACRLSERLQKEEARPERAAVYRILNLTGELSGAEQIYARLRSLPAEVRERIDVPLFEADCHACWYGTKEDARPGEGAGSGFGAKERLQRLSAVRDKWRRISSLFSEEEKKHAARGAAPGSRAEQLLLEKHARYDFRRYLKKFAVTAEELQSDPETFDYIAYCLGLSRYGNMPLIEPAETREAVRIRELIIAIDTSGSCSLSVVRRFLSETRAILTDRTAFFSRMNVHIIQCDSVIQSHAVITSVDDWKAYEQTLAVSGRGGTDFTPVFRFVEKLRRDGLLKHPKGLLYFTDGDGIYPERRPDYETAFVFADYRFLRFRVPPWAVRLCLDLDGKGMEFLNSKGEHP